MALFDDSTQNQLKGILNNMKDNVNLLYFTQEFECDTCSDGNSLVTEISSLSEKINLKTYDFVEDSKIAEKYGVDKIPAIVVLDKDEKDYGIKFYGVPGGYEINSFLGSIMEVSGKKEEISDDIEKKISGVDKDVHVQVFVTLNWPYCPGAVSAAHRLALESDKIKADMVESSTFNHLAIKYNVSSVPKIIINEEHELHGAQPIEEFMKVIESL